MKLNHNIITAVAESFAVAHDVEGNIYSAICAFVNQVATFAPKRDVYYKTGVALTGSDEDYKAATRAGFKFCIQLAQFDHIVSVKKDGYTIDDNGVAAFRSYGQFIFTDASTLGLAVAEDKGFHGIYAKPVSDYGYNGVNANGDYIFNKVGCQSVVSQAAVNGVNAAQANGYASNDAIEAAAIVYKAIAANADVITKAVTKRSQKDVAKAGFKAKETAVVIANVSEGYVSAHAEAFGVIADNGHGYFRIGLDARGRQYAVGSVNHFGPGVLALVTQSDHFAEEVIEKAKGFTVTKALNAISKIRQGDISAASAFFTKEVGITKKGQAVFKYSFSHNLLAAALVIAANQFAAQKAA